MDEPQVHALDYLNVLRRRKYWLIVPIVGSVVVGILLVLLLPKEYRSTATLAVAAPIVSPNLVGPTASLDNQDRLRALEQQLLSAPILSQLVRDEKIGDGTLTDARANQLRRQIKFGVPDPVVSTNEIRRLDTFLVSYGDSDPARAQRIANRLVNIFVNENSKTRTEQAQDTAAFLQMSLRDSQYRLDQLEQQLRKAKESHMGQLPEQTQANLQTLSGLRQQQESTASALRTEQDRLSLIVRQIDAMTQGNSAMTPAAAAASSPEARVVAVQRELDQAQAMYTDIHPEVVRLKEELAAAKAAVVAESKRPAADREAQLKVDPAYRQLLADKAASELRINELRRSEADARRQIGVYQARVEGAPMVEQQLAGVQREYDLEKQQYSDLANKLHAATMVESVERNGGTEQFTVLYAASLPSEPTKPVPLRVMLFSIMAGLVLGGAAVFGREYFDRSVHDANDIQNEFDVPLLGEVSRIGAA
jgi:polysaccharide chain length determinant protein (PEP-CTERM system associated)